MSTNILLRRSAITGRIPTTAQLNLGELAINTADGKIYFKRYDPVANTESIIDISSNLDAAAILAELITVDGAGSGLDSDLLDGFEGTYYLDWTNTTNKPDPVITLGGDLTGSVTLTDLASGTLNATINATTVTAGTYGSASEVPVFTVDGDGRLTAANTVSVAGVSNTTWTAANTTFTIDTADGNSYNTIIDTFNVLDVTTNITVGGTVDGVDIATRDAILTSTTTTANAALPKAGGTMTGDILYNDNVKAMFGTSNDLEIYHDGSNSYIHDRGVGNLNIKTNVFRVYNAGGTEIMANFIQNGAAELYHDAIKKFATSAAGIDVTGNIVVSGTVDGRDVATDGAKLDLLEDGLDLTLTGKVTGTASSNTGVMTLITELANTGVTAGSYGSSTAIPIITVDEDGRITLASTASVAGVDDLNWTTANNTLTLETGDGTTYLVPIEAFNDISANNITVTGTVDGRDLATDGSKLDLIEDGATADQTAADIRGLGFFDATNDGAGSALDADLLDGYHASELLSQAANTASSQIGDGLVTISGGTGLTGSGNFNLNDFADTTFTLTHADTSSVADVTNTLGSVLSSATFDTFGHVQTVTSVDLDLRYYTQTELNSGQLDNQYYTETELDTGQLDNRYYTESELNAGQLNSLYYTESELNAGQLNSLYYTESESDTKFVDVTGDTMTGPLIVDAALTVNQDIIQEESRFTSIKQTTAATTQVAILSFFHASYAAAEVLVTSTSGGERHITKLLLTHDGTTAVATEYGVVYTGSELAAFDVAIAGSLLELRATPASSSSTVFKTVATLIDV